MVDFAGGMAFDIHGVFGHLGFILMHIHAVWALGVLLKKEKRDFTHPVMQSG
jgi:hypothetical protein